MKLKLLLILEEIGIEIIEIPVRWNDSTDSRLRPFRDSLNTLLELLLVKFYSKTGFYK